MKSHARMTGLLIIGLAVAGVSGATALGDSTLWTDATGNHRWCDPSNWSAGLPEDLDPGPPTSAEIAAEGAPQGGPMIGPGDYAECTYLYHGTDCVGRSIGVSGGGLRVAYDAYVGEGYDAVINQLGGIVHVYGDLILGRNRDVLGEYVLSGGELRVDGNFEVGRGDNVHGEEGDGIFSIPGSNGQRMRVEGNLNVGCGDGVGIVRGSLWGTAQVCEIYVAEKVTIGSNGCWEYITGPPETIVPLIVGQSFEIKSQDAANNEGLRSIGMSFAGSGAGTFEVAGMMDSGLSDNFALGKLSVEDGFSLHFVDFFDNGNRTGFGKECLFTADLWIDSLSRLDVYGYYVYLPGNQVDLLNSWIFDGRLFSSLGAIEAVYDVDYNWTYVTPEPGTLSGVVLGALILQRRRREKCGLPPHG